MSAPALPAAGQSASPRAAYVQTGLFVLMELAWIAAAALFADAAVSGNAHIGILWACALYPVGLAIENQLRRFAARRWVVYALRAAAFGVCAAALAVLALPAGERLWSPGASPFAWLVQEPAGHRLITLAVIGLFCWSRGTLLSGRALNVYAAALGLQIGLFVLLAIFALSAWLEIAWPGAASLSFAFILCGLLALWHVRASRGSGATQSSRRNPAAAVLGLALVFGLGLIVAALADRGILEAILASIGRFFDFLFSLLPEPQPSLLEDDLLPPGSDGISGSGDSGPLWQFSELWARIYDILLLTVIGGMVAWILYFNLSSLLKWLGRHRHTPGLDYDRSQSGWGDTLRQLWQSLRAAAADRLKRLGLRLRLRPRAPGPDEPARRAYLRLERTLTERGWPRHSFETPFDYARRMKPEWPAPGTDLDLLTRRYTRARYGEPGSALAGAPAGRWRKFLKKIRRSTSRVRHRHSDEHEKDAARHEP